MDRRTNARSIIACAFVALALVCDAQKTSAENGKGKNLRERPTIEAYVDPECLSESSPNSATLTSDVIFERASKLLPEVPEFATEVSAAFADVECDPSSFVLTMMYMKDKWLLAKSRVTERIEFVNREGSIPATDISEESRSKMLRVDVVELSDALFVGEDCFGQIVRYVVDVIEFGRTDPEDPFPLKKSSDSRNDVLSSDGTSPTAVEL